jgi:hypothetical protein
VVVEGVEVAAKRARTLDHGDKTAPMRR